MRPELWDPAPEAVVTLCTSIGAPSLADAAAVLVASNRPPLVRHAAEMIQWEAATTGGRVLPPTPTRGGTSKWRSVATTQMRPSTCSARVLTRGAETVRMSTRMGGA
jgi:hypothetical protein